MRVRKQCSIVSEKKNSPISDVITNDLKFNQNIIVTINVIDIVGDDRDDAVYIATKSWLQKRIKNIFFYLTI